MIVCVQKDIAIQTLTLPPFVQKKAFRAFHAHFQIDFVDKTALVRLANVTASNRV